MAGEGSGLAQALAQAASAASLGLDGKESNNKGASNILNGLPKEAVAKVDPKVLKAALQAAAAVVNEATGRGDGASGDGTYVATDIGWE